MLSYISINVFIVDTTFIQCSIPNSICSNALLIEEVVLFIIDVQSVKQKYVDRTSISVKYYICLRFEYKIIIVIKITSNIK